MAKDTLTQDNFDPFQPIGLAADRLVSNLINSRELTNQQDGADVVGTGGFPRTLEGSEVDRLPIDCDARDKTLPARVPENALESGYGGNIGLVGTVLVAASLSQIRECVIIPPTIRMVDQLRRPLTCAVEPRQPACFVEEAVDAYDAIAVQSGNAASHSSDKIGSIIAIFPPEDSGLRIIIEKPPEPFNGQRACAHFVWHASEPHEQKNENGDDERGSSAEDKKRALDQAEFVKAGLERIRRFEERAAGIDASMRKRRI